MRGWADFTVETDETFSAILSLLNSTDLSSRVTLANGLATITNDDFTNTPTPTATFTVSSEETLDTTHFQIFTIHLSGTVTAPVTIEVTAKSLTAKSGIDFVATTQSLTFSDSVRTNSYAVVIQESESTTPSRKYQIELNATQTNGQSIDASSVGIGKIINTNTGWQFKPSNACFAASSGSGGAGGGSSGSGV